MIVDGSFSIKIESEEDILLIAELLQRRKGKSASPTIDRKVEKHRQVNVKPLNETQQKIVDVLKERYPAGEFSTSQASSLIKQKFHLGKSSTHTALRQAVRNEELFKVKTATFSFLEHDIAIAARSILPNEDYLLDLMSDRPDGLLEVCRIAKTLSNELVLVIAGDGIYCRLTDGHQQMMLDISVERSLFSGYQVKKGIEFKVDVSALYTRLERSKQLHLSMKGDSSPLMIGNYELAIDSYRDFDGRVVPPIVSDVKSELLINRQNLERILSDNAVNCQHIDIIAEKDHLAFESHGEAGDYKPAIIKDGYRCIEPSRSRLHYQDTLIRCLKSSKCETVKIGIGAFLHVEFVQDPAVKISLFLATKKELEAVQGVSKNGM